MRYKTKLTMLFIATLILFSGCSKDIKEYNKPAIYWYENIVKAIANEDMEKADSYYSSLQGEHISSPLLPEATMIMAIAHMHNEEYLLTSHFLNEYVKRYANVNEQEFSEFLKIKSMYMALPNPRRDQILISDAIKKAKRFKKAYPYSMYITLVDTMLTNLLMAESALNETIASLYDRVDKPKSAEYYRAKQTKKWIVWDNLNRANTVWYREWFEGDGTASWYGFVIPDTQSIVSRNSNNENDSNDEDLGDPNSWYDFVVPSSAKVDKNVTEESWYDFVMPSSYEDKKEVTKEETKEEVKVVETQKVETPKTDNGSWYDFMMSETPEEQKLEEELENKDANWYDFMLPDSDGDTEVKEKKETKEKDSSWYDFVLPASK